VRADRLVSLLLLLQPGQRRTAEELARRLEVSVRTIYRDVEALISSGVPVTATRGPEGGITLLPGWRTNLTGLTDAEIQALAVSGAEAALEDVGLAAAFQSGSIKLAASLPAVQRASAERARQRLHIDPTSFWSSRDTVPHLAELREATFGDTRVRLRYRDYDGRVSTRTVDPYGLVIKADRWYIVAGTARGVRVYRGARIERVTLLEETFARPPAFDLPTFWREWSKSFANERPTYEVTLRLTAAGAERLAKIRPANERDRIAPAKDVVINFEREAIALGTVIELGSECEVLTPPSLRERLRALAEHLHAIYSSAASAAAGGARDSSAGRLRRKSPRRSSSSE